MSDEKISGFKGFDKDFKCRDKQYQPEQEYTKKNAKICSQGIHFCENPLDVFNYYPPKDGNRYAEIEGSGKIDKKEKEDSKVAATKVKIGLEINLKTMIQCAVKFIFSKVEASKETTSTTGNYANAATTGNYANAATTGESANAATTGYRANAATTGNYANAEVKGCESIAAGIGIANKAKGALGCWIVLAEWFQDKDYKWHIKSVKTVNVDGENIKADTWYILKDNKFIEVKN